MLDALDFIRQSLIEDTGPADHSSLATIPGTAAGSAVLLAKEAGVIAGLSFACGVFTACDPELKVRLAKKDGDRMEAGDEVLTVKGPVRAILRGERVALNGLQRMSGIATLTARFVKAVEGTGARILDTRKTTPLFRAFEKEAVRLGGGFNHRMGLYDMVMLKDNHIDFAGGIGPCIEKTNAYLARLGLELEIEIEVRNESELQEVLAIGKVNRIMLDNFEPDQLKRAVARIAGKYVTEASGGMTLDNVRAYALTGVNDISVGALTHSYRSLDLSLKAV